MCDVCFQKQLHKGELHSAHCVLHTKKISGIYKKHTSLNAENVSIQIVTQTMAAISRCTNLSTFDKWVECLISLGANVTINNNMEWRQASNKEEERMKKTNNKFPICILLPKLNGLHDSLTCSLRQRALYARATQHCSRIGRSLSVYILLNHFSLFFVIFHCSTFIRAARSSCRLTKCVYNPTKCCVLHSHKSMNL